MTIWAETWCADHMGGLCRDERAEICVAPSPSARAWPGLGRSVRALTKAPLTWCADPMGGQHKLGWGGLQRARRLVLDGRDMHRL